MSEKLTQAEADELLNMLKYSLINEINFPEKGNSTEFNVKGSTYKDLFAIRIYRGRINNNKYEIGARIKKNGILLLELHINPGKPHLNPDGTKLVGSHWHIYTEEFYRSLAFPADDIRSNDFVNNTIHFLERFNVIEKPDIHYQLELL